MATCNSQCQGKKDRVENTRQLEDTTRLSVMEFNSTKTNKCTISHPMDRAWLTQRESHGKKLVTERTQDQAITYDRDLTPMERWGRETQIERHWDGIQSFMALPTRKRDDPGSRSRDETDDGTWIPSSFSRKEAGRKTVGC